MQEKKTHLFELPMRQNRFCIFSISTSMKGRIDAVVQHNRLGEVCFACGFVCPLRLSTALPCLKILMSFVMPIWADAFRHSSNDNMETNQNLDEKAKKNIRSLNFIEWKFELVWICPYLSSYYGTSLNQSLEGLLTRIRYYKHFVRIMMKLDSLKIRVYYIINQDFIIHIFNEIQEIDLWEKTHPTYLSNCTCLNISKMYL